MDLKNISGNQKQIDGIKTANTAQIAGKSIELAATSPNTTKKDAKISDAPLQEKVANKGFWGAMRTIAANPFSTISCALFVPVQMAAKIIAHPIATLSNPVKAVKEAFNDSLLADKFIDTKTGTESKVNEEKNKQADAKIEEQVSQKNGQATPEQSETEVKESLQKEHTKAEPTVSGQKEGAIPEKSAIKHKERLQKYNKKDETITYGENGQAAPDQSETELKESLQKENTKDDATISDQKARATPEPSVIQQQESLQKENIEMSPSAIKSKISEEDIKASWAKCTFNERRILLSSFNREANKMSPFWSKFLSWFQAIFTTNIETKKFLLGRIVESNASTIQPTKDIRQLIKASVDNELELMADLEVLDKENNTEATIKNAIEESQSQLKNAEELLKNMKDILNLEITRSLDEKSKLKLVQQAVSEAKKYAELKEKITTKLQKLHDQDTELYEKVRSSIHNQQRVN